VYQPPNRWFKWVSNFEKRITVNAKSSYTKRVYSSSVIDTTEEPETESEVAPSDLAETASIAPSASEVSSEESDYSDSFSDSDS
jgi:hypothetical protein